MDFDCGMGLEAGGYMFVGGFSLVCLWGTPHLPNDPLLVIFCACGSYCMEFQTCFSQIQPGRGDNKPGEALDLPAIDRALGGPV